MTAIYNKMGFHTEASMEREKVYGPGPITRNGVNIASYFPILGALIPGVGLCKVALDRKRPLSERIYCGTRGTLSVLGLGLLFLIPDLIVTIHRFLCTKAPGSHLNNGPRNTPQSRYTVTPEQQAQYRREMQDAPMYVG